MKIIVTGSLGNISKPLVAKLVTAGHAVGVISSKQEKAIQIERLGATPLIGSVADTGFVSKSFEGADAVYTMVPPDFLVPDYSAFSDQVIENYVKAIKRNRINYVVNLSSIGAALAGKAPLSNYYNLETRLNELNGLNIVQLRPGMFYTNFYGQVNLILSQGIMGHNIPGNANMIMTHPHDIADTAFAYLDNLQFKGHTIKHIISDVVCGDEAAEKIGVLIGNPNVKWVQIPDDQLLAGLMQNGFSKDAALTNVIDMGIAIREGLLDIYYSENKLAVTAERKFIPFMQEVFSRFSTAV
jgi:nucleoside-diphosphate-sugar epimerase